MSFVYDIKKQLCDIGLDFEKKFIRTAQEAPPGAPSPAAVNTDKITNLARKMLDNLQTSAQDLYSKDLKNLQAFIYYCLDKKISVDGLRLVYRVDANESAFSAGIGHDFKMLADDVKAKYAEYEKAFMVNKEGLVKKLTELVQQAETSGNKIAQVMISKVIAEANSVLQLGMKKTPHTEAAGGGDEPTVNPVPDNSNGKENGSGQANRQGNSGTPTTKSEMQDSIKQALRGAEPLSNVLDLDIIKRFFEVVRDMFAGAEKERYVKMYSEVIGAPANSPNVVSRLQSVSNTAVDGIRYVDNLLQQFVKPRIQMQDVVGSAGNTNVDNFMNIMRHSSDTTASKVKNLCDILNWVIQNVLTIEEDLLRQDNDFITRQMQTGRAWMNEIGKLSTASQIVARNDVAKLR